MTISNHEYNLINRLKINLFTLFHFAEVNWFWLYRAHTQAGFGSSLPLGPG